MFEVGFSELCMVALVALLVIGPKRLPKAARIAGFWIGKMRRMTETLKAEIHTELQAEEIRQLINKQTNLNEFKVLLDESIINSPNFSSSIEQTLVNKVSPAESHDSN